MYKWRSKVAVVVKTHFCRATPIRGLFGLVPAPISLGVSPVCGVGTTSEASYLDSLPPVLPPLSLTTHRCPAEARVTFLKYKLGSHNFPP